MIDWLIVGTVTFAEFTQNVVDTWSSGKELDVHWRPQYKLCHPCYIKYDFIGHFEKLNEDAKHVLTKITGSGGRRLPFKNAFNARIALLQRREKFYANLSRDIVRKLIRIYKIDYEMFGYDYHWACNDC